MIVQDSLCEAMIDGAREVFETMMFMTLEISNELYEGIDGPAILGSITFRGSIEGMLTVCCGQECARQIAINMLGMEPGEDLSDDEVQDAMGEVANMVMGSLKARILDEVGDLQVSIPTVVRGAAMESSLSEGAIEIAQTVSIDDSIANLTLLYREAKK